MIAILRKIDDGVYRVEYVLLCLLVTVMVLGEPVVVLARVLVDGIEIGPVRIAVAGGTILNCHIWLDEFCRLLVIWVGFVGGSIATRRGRHINIDAIGRILRPRSRLGSRIATNTFALAVTIFLIKAAFDFVLVGEIAVRNDPHAHKFMSLARMIDPTSPGFPEWIFMIVIPVALLVIAYRFFLAIISGLADLIAGRIPKPEAPSV